MLDHLLFYIGLSFLLIHEMDAVRCREWRIIPGLSLLNDTMGYYVFLMAHIPLLLLLFIGLRGHSSFLLMQILDAFFIIHVFLHLAFLKSIKNEFKSTISWIIIAGAGIFGLLHLIIFR
jgi:hypothetical protein